VFLEGLGEMATWDVLIESQPALSPSLSEDQLQHALQAFADYADLKSPHTVGHSRAVANLVADAARGLGFPETEVNEVQRAALIHDIGALGVPNNIWDKPSSFSPAEWERVRLHPYLAERTLARPKQLASLGALAALHHERLDGSGYPRGLAGPGLSPLARLLAVADVYHALIEPRPHRPALTSTEAERAVRGEVIAGRLDGYAVNAVLTAAGHRVRRRAEQPAGLTRRELEVLNLLARGHTNRAIAGRLDISDKTVGNHVEHLYAKIGVSTRAGACLFAARHGLVDGIDIDTDQAN
jgi:HD-GYP domain-containing protein (c-di-GMP phosphodiesterase class II)